MIVYFADRRFNILGHASTKLPNGLTIVDDLKTEDAEAGVATFECIIPFDPNTRDCVKECLEVGNFILYSHNDENKYFTIIDTEWNEKNREVFIYAEDAGLDLLNEIVGGYEATEAKPISFYIEKFAYDSGFVIGTNEISSLTRKLSWDSTETVTSRLASVATQFDNAEISYSFDVKGLRVVKKYINIHKKRGHDTGVQLRMNKEIDNIVTSKSVANVATALRVTGGIPEDSESAITLDGEKYDDGDIFLEGTYLKSRKAHAVWSRYLAEEGTYTGHICKRFEYDTTSKSELLNRAISELKKVREIEVNYEIDITDLPDNIKVGDRVNIIDDNNELYVSSRILLLETSVANNTQTATIGEYLIKDSGISQKVADLAKAFSEKSASAEYAKTIAKHAKEIATNAQLQSDQALAGALNAQEKAENAMKSASDAQVSASNAQTMANDAQLAVENVEKDVESLETSVSNAQAAAEQARQAALTAETKASEAQAASVKAQEDAALAKDASDEARTQAVNAQTKAEDAKTVAEQAIADAEEASTIAEAAKQDAVQAKNDIDSFAENLTTLENTMNADYARKTDLTEATASLQSQISQNANEISSTVSRVEEIDETVNNAQEIAQSAQTLANTAQVQADKAIADAEAAQSAADTAAQAAANAQSEANNAKQAAATAQSVADKAESDLEEAKTDLATVQSRVDATEEDIAKAQTAVNAAQAAADKAKADALEASQKSATAQLTADAAATNAANAQKAADDADAKATVAQTLANEAKGNASSAQATADQAKADAQAAQLTADTAKTNATTAQNKADEAAQAALLAQQAADAADARVAQAETDLATAQQNLVDVTARVGSTEEEIAQAKDDVVAAQAAADKAKADAATAQSTANTAKANAATAQQAANQAKTAADDAQEAADDAKDAADKAQADVDALTIRVTTTETKITQNSEEIALRATKEEVSQTLGGYYTKSQTEALVKVEADKITSQASEISGLKTRMSTVEQTASGLSVSLQTVEDKADTAKSTADTAKATANTANTNATNAAKTATNFLSYDSTNGLLVGNKSGGSWSGYRTQVKSDSFNILDASGNQLASYGANEINLGLNREDTAIKMCDGRLAIKLDSDRYYSQISGEVLQMISKATTSDDEGDQFETVGAVAMFPVGVRGQRKARLYCFNDYGDGSTKTVGSNIDVDPEYIMLETCYGSFDRYARITLSPGYINIEAEDYVQVTTPFLTMNGDLAVTGAIEDEFGAKYSNGLAAYTGSGTSAINPDTTIEHLILTNNNTPMGSGYFMYIMTLFYSTKSSTANRMQIAWPYNRIGSAYFRYYYNGTWSNWRRQTNEDEFDDYVVAQGTSGSWTYKKWNSGTCEAWCSVDVSNLACTTAMGVLYRSAAVSTPAFPFTITNPNVVASYESPGYGAFLWPTGTTTTTTDPTDYFLVRHASGTIASGTINLQVKGKWK